MTATPLYCRRTYTWLGPDRRNLSEVAADVAGGAASGAAGKVWLAGGCDTTSEMASDVAGAMYGVGWPAT